MLSNQISQQNNINNNPSKEKHPSFLPIIDKIKENFEIGTKELFSYLLRNSGLKKNYFFLLKFLF